MRKELNFRTLFNRAALPGEKFDDDWIENAMDLIVAKDTLSVATSGIAGALGRVLEQTTYISFGVSLSPMMT